MKHAEGFSKGLFRENPVAALLLGLCPAAAVTGRVIDALWMSAGFLAVLLLSSLCLSLLGALSPAAARDGGAGLSRGRWIGSLVITACLASCFDLLLRAFAPGASARLGIYAPLVAVNCIVLGRVELAAGGLSIGRSLRDAAGTGAGFAGALLLVSVVREALGAGTITLFPIGTFGGSLAVPLLAASPARAFVYATGGLLCLGYLAGASRLLSSERRRGESDRA